ncbi:hypothetical protein FRC18_001961 [Serendipita sp. 400]|nr:hypothetical protein FRC18_001961 [Serendipita sp. 400]
MHPRAQASSALGWVSIACWILVYTPQILENYEIKSGEGLSVLFVLIWLAGDICNLLGAAIAGLIPTVIILAVYYTLCDLILLFQIYYYRLYNRYRSQGSTATSSRTLVQPSPIHTEQTPLLSSQTTKASDSTTQSTLPPWLSRGFQYFGGVAFVTFAGLSAWWISGRKAAGDGDNNGSDEIFDWTSQIFGWASAILYST